MIAAQYLDKWAHLNIEPDKLLFITAVNYAKQLSDPSVSNFSRRYSKRVSSLDKFDSADLAYFKIPIFCYRMTQFQ